MRIAILGAGMVGSAMAQDLAPHYDVRSFDINSSNLDALKAIEPGVSVQKADLRQFDQYPQLLESFDYIISAVPGFMGYQTLEAIINSGKNVVDISFFPEDALELDALAKQRGVTAIVDCGVAPGMSNLVLGYENSKMKITDFSCMVGGLPKRRVKPFEYKAPFSPIDVLEEYTRPARYMENGFVVTRPALTDPELHDLEIVGTLESFNTDGLRSLLYTMPHIPNMKEKTLRYPGHIALITALKQAGFLEEDKIKVGDQMVSPKTVTSAILFDQWKLGAAEPEFTVMTIELRGEKDGVAQKVSYFLYDEFDVETQMSSMARTTGFTCTAALHLLIKGLFAEKGVFPPELVGSHSNCYDYVMDYLRERNVIYKRTVN